MNTLASITVGVMRVIRLTSAGKTIYLLIPPEHEADENVILEKTPQGERTEHFATVP